MKICQKFQKGLLFDSHCRAHKTRRRLMAAKYRSIFYYTNSVNLTYVFYPSLRTCIMNVVHACHTRMTFPYMLNNVKVVSTFNSTAQAHSVSPEGAAIHHMRTSDSVDRHTLRRITVSVMHQLLHCDRFLANVNSSSCSLYVIGRPSVVCLSVCL